MRFASGLDVRERAGPFLAALVRETGETAHIGVLRQGQAISVRTAKPGTHFVFRQQSEERGRLIHPRLVRQFWPTFRRWSLKRAIASMPFQVFTRNTIRNAKGLRAEMAKVCRAGYAVDAEEYEEGLTCIASPIFDRYWTGDSSSRDRRAGDRAYEEAHSRCGCAGHGHRRWCVSGDGLHRPSEGAKTDKRCACAIKGSSD